MLMAHLDTIREVIAFPKTASATDPMTEAPAQPDRRQLEELGLSPKKGEAGDRRTERSIE
jgi:aspartyl-tRNA synthetase